MSSYTENPLQGEPQKGWSGFTTRTGIVLGMFGLIVIVALGAAGYFYVQYQKTQDQLRNPTGSAQQEAQSLVDEVGKIIQLPTGEQPTIATVSDINKLKGQSFFAQAKNGDKVLIYTKAQKAILYDPGEHKIIEVGPVNLTQAAPTASASASASISPAPVKVALYNGTATTGLTSVIETKLKKLEPNVTVAVKENASKSTYTKTTVIDLSGKHPAEATALARDLNGEVGTLPPGEAKPDSGAELLVILGK